MQGGYAQREFDRGHGTEVMHEAEQMGERGWAKDVCVRVRACDLLRERV